MPNDDDIVTRARAALDGVTPGPWDAECGVHAIVGAETGLVAEVETDPDADFIASARTLVPELVEEVERLREVERAARAVAASDDCWGGTLQWQQCMEALRRALDPDTGGET